jgi:uncharacterized protein (TIGR00645 family)
MGYNIKLAFEYFLASNINLEPLQFEKQDDTGHPMIKFESSIEKTIFASRWLLAPFFIGLVVAILALFAKFAKELYFLLTHMFTNTGEQTIITILSLVDATLIACLLLIIIFSGYENFVSKIDFDNHIDRPQWMGKVGFSDLKIKLIGAIVAISAVELLKAFINMQHLTNTELAWRVGIHLTFVFSGVLFALTDFIVSKKSGGH